MDIEEIREAYKLAIADGYQHAAVAKATGVGVSSLKNFHNDDAGLGADYLSKLEQWLSARGFMDRTWASKDPFRGLIAALKGLVMDLEGNRSVDARYRILDDFFAKHAGNSVFARFVDTQHGREE